jgi:hypothetical protein
MWCLINQSHGHHLFSLKTFNQTNLSGRENHARLSVMPEMIFIKMSDWNKRRLEYLFGAVIGLVITFLIYFKGKDLIPSERLISLGSLMLTEKPKKGREPGKGGDHYVQFSFSGIEKPLKLSGVDYDCSDTHTLLSEFNTGDTLRVWVDKKDIGNSTYFRGDKIYGVTVGQKTYSDLNCRNRRFHRNQMIGTVAIGTLSIGCLIASILPRKPRLKIGKNTTYNVEPISVILIIVIGMTFLAARIF